MAKDLVDHFIGRGFKGKAMMVCIDKATAVRMYDKVKRVWGERLAAAKAEFEKRNKLPGYVITGKPEDSPEWQHEQTLIERIQFLTDTDMAVVVSQGQNEIAELAVKGLDIRPHRKRMVEEDLETKFKNPQDPFRLVFVCAMWMTGFDVPSCSTLYLDKPMRNHTLMQTIARANRVYPGKVNGLIVDYAGVFRSLEKALAIYGAPGTAGGGNKPVEDKTALVAALRQALLEVEGVCERQGVSVAAIQDAEGFKRIELLDDAVDALIASQAIKLQFLDLANTTGRLYKAILPDPSGQEFGAAVAPVKMLADKIRALTPPADISQIMSRVEDLLDASIAAEGYVIRDTEDGENRWIDLSGVDFDKLAETFKTGHKRTLNEKLKGKVAQKLMAMVRLNRTRMDYLEQFQALIDAYNAGSVNAEEFFKRLVAFAKSLNEEERRGMAEQLNDEELALFDLLTKPEIDLTAQERDKVKATARELLATLKTGKLVLDWRKRQQARAEVRVTIEKVLDDGLPRAYTPELFEEKATAVFQHVYDAYYGAGNSVYASA